MAIPEPPIDEVRALSRLAWSELAGGIGGIAGIQNAVAHRVYGMLGPIGAPVRVINDAITEGVYAGLRGGTALMGQGADAALARRALPEGPALSETRAGAAGIAVLTGLRGDELERDGSPLHAPMAVRVGGRPVPAEREALAEAFPTARPRLVIFLHGLMETEFSWSLGGGPDDETYGTRLERDLPVTALHVRYNSGRHISENGRNLAALIAEVTEAWPVPVTEVALVGHSMGGLVARSACWHAAEDEADWAGRVRHVVSLGTPHMGAPLERIVHVTTHALSALPETRPFGNFFRRRSAGIRDLRHGSLVDEDWQDRDPDALRAAACREIPLLEGARHCFVAATVTRDRHHPVARIVGDVLVLEPSASGRSRKRRLPFRDEDGMHVGGATHFALLNHPAVYARLREWLAPPDHATPPEE